jgi:hypothetical protein
MDTSDLVHHFTKSVVFPSFVLIMHTISALHRCSAADGHRFPVQLRGMKDSDEEKQLIHKVALLDTELTQGNLDQMNDACNFFLNKYIDYVKNVMAHKKIKSSERIS